MSILRQRWRMKRRTFLQAVGVSLSLPWLEAMGEESTSLTNAGKITTAEIPRRAYFSNWGFFESREGMPKDTGVDYTLTPTLSPLAAYKNDFTVISGLKAFSGGHGVGCCMLSGMNTPTNGLKLTSVDQQIADFYRGQTRVPSLVLAPGWATGFGTTHCSALSWSRNHTPISPENRPEEVFKQLFGVEDARSRDLRRNQMERTNSILDLVKDQAHDLEKKLGKDDRATVDQYFTSIRDFEERIKIDRSWLDRPKPQVAPIDFGKTTPMMNDEGMRRYMRLMFDVIALAFQTDSTRVVTHWPKHFEGGPVFKDRTKCPYDYHMLSHHGEDPEKLRMWALVDQVYMEEWAYFLGKLKGIKEGNGTLLDHTLAAWATTNGEGGHGRDKLPLLLCGGAGLGLKHQGHIVKKDVLIGNVWQTMVERIGMPLPKDFQGGQANGVVQEVL